MSECIPQLCRPNVPPDLETYSLQSNVRFNGTPFTIVIDCPPGFECAPGEYPRTIILDAGDIVIPRGASSVVVCDVVIPLTGGDADYAAVAEASRKCDLVGETGHDLIFKKGIPIFTDTPFPHNSCNQADIYIVFKIDETMTMIHQDPLNFPDSDPPTWNLEPIPPGCEISSTPEGLALHGTITATGEYKFTVTVAGTYIELGKIPVESTGSAKYTINIAKVSETPPPAAQVGVLYEHQLTVDGPASPGTQWSIVGELPPGLDFNYLTGFIFGTPTVEGTYEFTVCYNNDL